MSKKNNPKYVLLELCTAKHNAVMKEIEELNARCAMIQEALIGKDLQSGLVKTVSELRNQFVSMTRSSLSGKDKVSVVVALVAAIAAIIVALVK